MSQIEQEAPIIQQTFDLYKDLYAHVKTFPKKDQYLIGKRCEDALLSFLEYTLLAASAPKEQKARLLNIAAGKFDVLKILLRLAKELKMLDTKKYIELELKAREVGKMLGGWIRSLAKQTS